MAEHKTIEEFIDSFEAFPLLGEALGDWHKGLSINVRQDPDYLKALTAEELEHQVRKCKSAEAYGARTNEQVQQYSSPCFSVMKESFSRFGGK